MSNIQNRNAAMDILRFFCAFLVICIHVPIAGEIFFRPAVVRTAVPVFAMVTGYYYSASVKRKNKSAQIWKIFKLLILSMGLYLLWNVISGYFQNKLIGNNYEAWPFFAERVKYIFFSPYQRGLWIGFFLMNRPPFGDPLWYLSAILYVLLIMAAVELLFKRKYLYPLIPVLLIVNLVFGPYSQVIFGEQIDHIYTRNFLFTTLPFFLLGDFLYVSDAGSKISTKALLLILLLSLITGACEKRYIGNQELYVSSAFSASAMLLLAGKKPAVKNKALLKLADWGNKYSTHIYVLHLFLSQAIILASDILLRMKPQIPELKQLVSPIFVLLILLMFLGAVDKLKRILTRASGRKG